MHTIAQLYMQNSSAAPRGRGPLGGWPGHRRVNHLSKLISFLIEPPTARVPLQVICLERQGNGARTHASCFQNNADPYEQCFCGFALNRRLFYLQWCILGFGVLRKTKYSWRSLCADRGSFSVSILSSRHLEKQYQKTEDCASRQGSFSRVLGNRVFGKQKKENVMLLTMDSFPWRERWCFDLDIWGAGVRHERTPVELQSALTCTRAYRKQSLSRNFGFATCGWERRGAAGMARGRSVLMRQGSALASVSAAQKLDSIYSPRWNSQGTALDNVTVISNQTDQSRKFWCHLDVENGKAGSAGCGLWLRLWRNKFIFKLNLIRRCFSEMTSVEWGESICSFARF